MIKFGLVENVRNPIPVELEYDSLAEAFDDLFADPEPIEVPHDAEPEQYKKRCPAFTPALVPEGARLKNSTVEELSAIVFDLDDVPQPELVKALKALDTCYVFYTSWKDGKDTADGAVRGRLIVPFAKPVKAADWIDVWHRARAWSGLSRWVDAKCKDRRRLYFLPYYPTTNKRPGVSYHQDGPPLDVSTLPDVDRFEEPEAEITSLDLKAVAGEWKKRTDLKPFAEVLTKALAGEPFADPGERELIVFKLADRLAHRLPEANPETLIKYFASAFDALASTGAGCPTVEDFAAKFKAQQLFYAEERRLQKKAKEEQDATDQPWIVCHKETYYVLGPENNYLGPHTRTSFLATAEEALEGREGFSAYRVSEHGRVRKVPLDLITQYGRATEAVIYDLAAQKPCYDGANRELVLSPCPIRKVKPERSDEIDRWIDTFSDPTTLREWLACVTLLQYPCSALYISGVPGAGKSLLAQGLSRLWTLEGPTEAESVAGQWNDTLLQCPFVFADEQLPSEWQSRSGALRKVIQEIKRPLRQKFVSTASVRGAMRLLLAANNEDLLYNNENLTPEDLQAIVERFVHISAPRATSDYLKALNGRRVVDRWVSEDRLAAHALALSEEFEPDVGNRWLVDQHNPDFAIRVAVSSGPRSDACSAMVRQLDKIRNGRVDYGGEACISVTTMQLRSWWAMISSNRQPTDSILANALKAMSAGVDGQTFFVRARFLEVWNERTRACDPALLRRDIYG